MTHSTDRPTATPDAIHPVFIPNANYAQLPAAEPKSVAPTVFESTLVAWASSDKRSSVGIWECSPGEFPSRRDDCDELCVILSGSATLESADGHRIDVATGSVFVLPDGWSGRWYIHETLRKCYATLLHVAVES